jgi:hypothetical protein
MATYPPGQVPSEEGDSLERLTKEAPLTLMKALVSDTRSAQTWYNSRTRQSDMWWHSQWDCQYVDGKKWGADPDDENQQVWPWRGASDTRDRTVDMVVAEYLTVHLYAIMNAKIQTKSTRPIASSRQSQQATILLNWMLYSHMSADLDLDIPLAINWRNARGASVLWVDWEQARRMEHIKLNAQQLIAATQGAAQDWINDRSFQKDFITLIQSFSPVISTAEAKSIIQTLRDGGVADLPIPYVYCSRPRITALRPMIDILFDPDQDTLQERPKWMDRLEFVTEDELYDRITTAGYDEKFVKEACEFKGESTSPEFTARRATWPTSGYWQVYPGQPQAMKDKILLHHFYHRTREEDVPEVYCTVFHEGVDFPAKYEPYGYAHGEYPAHGLRFEKHERALLSSRGICEIAYTWEQEMKTQRDGRANRTELELRPPLLAPYQDVLRLKAEFAPGIILPERHNGNLRWMEITPLPAGSIELERAIMQKVDRYFGLFGAEIDPALKQLRQQENGDAILKELKPVFRQVFKLMQQFLPDTTVERVAGPLERPFQVSREEIQGEYEYSATVDMRDLDPEFLKEKLGFFSQLAQLDTVGVLDKVALLRAAAESIDYSLADVAITDTQEATNKEIMDENAAIDRIIGSGRDQPLPQGSNYQLRLQVLQSAQQEYQQNPALQKAIQNNPLVMQVLQNRGLFFQRQLQQQQNAQIGRMQVSQTFTKQAPQGTGPMGLLGEGAMGGGNGAGAAAAGGGAGY